MVLSLGLARSAQLRTALTFRRSGRNASAATSRLRGREEGVRASQHGDVFAVASLSPPERSRGALGDRAHHVRSNPGPRNRSLREAPRCSCTVSVSPFSCAARGRRPVEVEEDPGCRRSALVAGPGRGTPARPTTGDRGSRALVSHRREGAPRSAEPRTGNGGAATQCIDCFSPAECNDRHRCQLHRPRSIDDFALVSAGWAVSRGSAPKSGSSACSACQGFQIRRSIEVDPRLLTCCLLRQRSPCIITFPSSPGTAPHRLAFLRTTAQDCPEPARPH